MKKRYPTGQQTKKQTLFTITLLLVFLFAATVNTQARTYTSNTGTTGNWSSASTWSPRGTPGAGDVVVINGTVKNFPNTTTNLASITIASTGNLQGTGNLSISNYEIFTNNGTASIGTITANDNSKIINSGTLTSGDITLNNNSVFTNTGQVTNNGNFSDNSTAASSVSGSTSSLKTSGSFTVNNGSFTLTNGTVTVGTTYSQFASTVNITGTTAKFTESGTMTVGLLSSLNISSATVTVGGMDNFGIVTMSGVNPVFTDKGNFNMEPDFSTFTNGTSGTVDVKGNFINGDGFWSQFLPSTFTNNGKAIFEKDFTNYSNYTGTGGGASTIRGYSTNNGTINGTQDFCDSSAFTSSKIVDNGTQPTGTTVTHCGVSPLPVSLMSFTAQNANAAVLLNWETASELNNSYFEVLRSTNGIDFTVIGNVEGHGTTNAVHHYNFTDNNPVNGTAFYQLRQVDLNGASEKSPVVSVKNSNELSASNIKLYPNPVGNGNLNIEYTTSNASVINIQIVNMAGVPVYTTVSNSHPGINTLQADTRGLQPGLYIVLINDGQNQISSRFSK